MPKNIGFRVTGMYFGSKQSITQEIRVDVASPTPTVYDVMLAVIQKVKTGQVPGVSNFTFDPITPSPTDSLNSVTVEYAQNPKANLMPGTYFLQESKMHNPVEVFQYYHFSKDFTQKNTNNVFKLFNQQPEEPIVDNDIIVWRRVTILEGPNTGQRRVTADAKRRSDTIEASGLLG